MMKCNEDEMRTELSKLLRPDERLLYPLYCGYRPATILGGKLHQGYFGVTTLGRLLFVQYMLLSPVTAAGHFSSLTKLKRKKNFAGQQLIDMTFYAGKDAIEIHLQIAPKVFGCKFPDQETNLSNLMVLLDRITEEKHHG